MRYEIRELPLKTLLPATIRAEDLLARLDERALRHSVAEGFRERGHFFDAVGALWVEGQLVHLEDLVLHDAHMDARAPTHELTIAHAVLRARRRLWNAAPDWGLTVSGMAAFHDQTDVAEEIASSRSSLIEQQPESDDEDDGDEPDELAMAFAEIDAVLARSDHALKGGGALPKAEAMDPLGLVRDEEWDETERMEAWRAIIPEADMLPPALGAALLYDAWERIEPLRRQNWLGSLLVGSYLRMRGKVASHLFCLNIGLKSVRHERRRSPDRIVRLTAFLDAMAETAEAGLKELDRLSLAKTQMERRLKDRRSNSSLPGVIELLLSRPIVSANMVARHVDVTSRAALKLVTELGVREMTGRGRYRGWGVL